MMMSVFQAGLTIIKNVLTSFIDRMVILFLFLLPQIVGSTNVNLFTLLDAQCFFYWQLGKIHPIKPFLISLQHHF